MVITMAGLTDRPALAQQRINLPELRDRPLRSILFVRRL